MPADVVGGARGCAGTPPRTARRPSPQAVAEPTGAAATTIQRPAAVRRSLNVARARVGTLPNGVVATGRGQICARLAKFPQDRQAPGQVPPMTLRDSRLAAPLRSSLLLAFVLSSGRRRHPCLEGQASPTPSADDDWLGIVNTYRAMSGLGPGRTPTPNGQRRPRRTRATCSRTGSPTTRSRAIPATRRAATSPATAATSPSAAR